MQLGIPGAAEKYKQLNEDGKYEGSNRYMERIAYRMMVGYLNNAVTNTELDQKVGRTAAQHGNALNEYVWRAMAFEGAYNNADYRTRNTWDFTFGKVGQNGGYIPVGSIGKGFKMDVTDYFLTFQGLNQNKDNINTITDILQNDDYVSDDLFAKIHDPYIDSIALKNTQLYTFNKDKAEFVGEGMDVYRKYAIPQALINECIMTSMQEVMQNMALGSYTGVDNRYTQRLNQVVNEDYIRARIGDRVLQSLSWDGEHQKDDTRVLGFGTLGQANYEAGQLDLRQSSLCVAEAYLDSFEKNSGLFLENYNDKIDNIDKISHYDRFGTYYNNRETIPADNRLLGANGWVGNIIMLQQIYAQMTNTPVPVELSSSDYARYGIALAPRHGGQHAAVWDYNNNSVNNPFFNTYPEVHTTGPFIPNEHRRTTTIYNLLNYDFWKPYR